MKLNSAQLDAITEIVNIGTGRAANSLSEIIGSRIELTVPCLKVFDFSDIRELDEMLGLEVSTLIQQCYSGEVSGQAMLAFPERDAFDLARTIGGIEISNEDMDEELHGVLEEVGNIVLNAVLGSVANLLNCNFSYTLPKICSENSLNEVVHNCLEGSVLAETMVLFADTTVTVASHNIKGSLLLLFETGDIRVLLKSLVADSVV